MIRQPVHVEAQRPPLRGICLVVKGNQPAQRPKPSVPVGMTAKFPHIRDQVAALTVALRGGEL
jgi:hypothetical protein